MKETFAVGTRASLLARTQTEQFVNSLKKKNPDKQFAIQEIRTQGDVAQKKTLSDFGYKGIFTREIDDALLNQSIDLAVHSLKDMPSKLPKGLLLGAIAQGVDVRDAVVSREGKNLASLPSGSVVGTASLRRTSLLKNLYPHVEVKVLRGNLDTRLRKLENKEFDAIVVAAAGMIRLGYESRITEYLAPKDFVPAIGQGYLAITCREDDHRTKNLLSSLNDSLTLARVALQRAFMEELEGSCQVPMGCFVDESTDEGLSAFGFLGSPDGKRVIRKEVSGNVKDGIDLGRQLAEKVLEGEGKKLLAEMLGA